MSIKRLDQAQQSLRGDTVDVEARPPVPTAEEHQQHHRPQQQHQASDADQHLEPTEPNKLQLKFRIGILLVIVQVFIVIATGLFMLVQSQNHNEFSAVTPPAPTQAPAALITDAPFAWSDNIFNNTSP